MLALLALVALLFFLYRLAVDSEQAAGYGAAVFLTSAAVVVLGGLVVGLVSLTLAFSFALLVYWSRSRFPSSPVLNVCAGLLAVSSVVLYVFPVYIVLLV